DVVDGGDVRQGFEEVGRVEVGRVVDARVERLQELGVCEVDHPRVVDDHQIVGGGGRLERRHQLVPHLVVGQCLDVDLDVRVVLVEVGHHGFDDVGVGHVLHEEAYGARSVLGDLAASGRLCLGRSTAARACGCQQHHRCEEADDNRPPPV